MGAAFDLVSTVKAASLFEAMQIVPHNRGMIGPALSGCGDIVVPVKKPYPATGFVSFRQTAKLRIEIDAKNNQNNELND